MGRSFRDQSCRLHHITARGNDRQPLYEDPTDRNRFYGILARALHETPVLCHHEVQMGNHYHLVLEGSPKDISRLMWLVNHRYAVSYNARHGRSGHLFGQRFRSAPVADVTGARALVVYVALNPVRAGFVDHPVQWEYGAFRAHAGLETPRPHLTTRLVDQIFDGPTDLFDACQAALDRRTGGRPALATILPARSALTRLHVTQTATIFGYAPEEIAAHYRVSMRTLTRWLVAADAR